MIVNIISDFKLTYITQIINISLYCLVIIYKRTVCEKTHQNYLLDSHVWKYTILYYINSAFDVSENSQIIYVIIIYLSF